MARIFGVAILVSAALLFCLQPMVGEMLLDRWKKLPSSTGRVWTDDFSNLVTAFRW